VSSLIDPKEDESSNGLAELAAELDAEEFVEEKHSDDEAGDDFKWEPDAILADSSKVRGIQHKSDILQMLMTIYGSNELFIKEYRFLLADLLVNKVDYDTDKQVQQLEVLKIRFGESAMHACDVMLRDIANSKRINSHISPKLAEKKVPEIKLGPATTPARNGRVTRQSTIAFRTRKTRSSQGNDRKVAQKLQSSTSSTSKTSITYEPKFLEASIISKEFWPDVQDHNIKMPGKLQKLAESYSEEYTKLKAPRVLKTMPSLGRVHLEIELEDRKLDLQVSPAQATCLAQFEDSGPLSLVDISEGMGCDVDLARRSVVFWVQKKVIKEEKSEDGVLRYYPLEKLTGDEDSSVTISLPPEEANYDDVMRNHNQVESKIIESYIMGVVLDFKAVPLSHIKNMLKLMTSDESMRLTDRQIMDTLDRMTRKGKIECRDGRYKSIKRKPGR